MERTPSDRVGWWGATAARRVVVVAVCLSATASPSLAAAPTDDAEAPESVAVDEALDEAFAIELSPAVTRLLEGPVLSDAQKRQRRLYHGQWDDLDTDGLTPGQRAWWFAMQGQIDPDADPATLADDPAAAYWLARVELRRGNLEAARDFADLVPDDGVEDPNAPTADIPREAVALLRSEIDEARARFDAAAQRLIPVREQFQHSRAGTPAELTAAAKAIILLARLQGRPSADYRLALSLLDAAIEQDPLAWEPRLVQAQLLFDKDNRGDAADLVTEVLTLNPRCAAAWELGARLSLERWDFAGALEVIEHLREIAPQHPASEELAARRALKAGELDAADAAVAAMLADRPEAPATLAWQAAASARRLDAEAAEAELLRLEEGVPGLPLGPTTVAGVLSDARLYTDAERYFREAIARQPNDAAPRLALGLMLMQVGDLEAARRELADAARLDPFHAGVNNSLDLVQEMLGWPTIETENFLIRYAPGPDAALARDLAPMMEAIRADLRDVFGRATDHITQVELLPDAETFAVRITGESELGALAACTGDVLAMAPPRLGAAQTGVYHWSNVIRHEYVHAIIFDLGGQIAPRWFHEGTATYFEELQRAYDAQQALAAATNAGELIPFDELGAAFMSPRIGFAYQQSGWMIEYLVGRFGRDVLLDMMSVYASAGDDTEALRIATGLGADVFMADFEQWAEQQVRAWGLYALEDPEVMAILSALLQQPPQSLTEATLAALPPAVANHPDVLRLLAVRALEGDDEAAAEAALTRYALSRPTDPWPQRHLAAMALRRGDEVTVLGTLEWLDQRELSDPQWAVALANLHRRNGDFVAGYGAMERALFREPYNASFREQAAAIALQGRMYELALYQIEAIVDLEPDEPQHQRRLDAVRKLVTAK